MRFLFRWIFRLVLFALWLVLSVVMGGFLLAAKETMGINVFSATGYHAFKECLVDETQKAAKEIGVLPACQKDDLKDVKKGDEHKTGKKNR